MAETGSLWDVTDDPSNIVTTASQIYGHMLGVGLGNPIQLEAIVIAPVSSQKINK